jgi:hypothetical protein
MPSGRVFSVSVRRQLQINQFYIPKQMNAETSTSAERRLGARFLGTSITRRDTICDRSRIGIGGRRHCRATWLAIRAGGMSLRAT